jgi:hypothetical protein
MQVHRLRSLARDGWCQCPEIQRISGFSVDNPISIDVSLAGKTGGDVEARVKGPKQSRLGRLDLKRLSSHSAWVPVKDHPLEADGHDQPDIPGGMSDVEALCRLV